MCALCFVLFSDAMSEVKIIYHRMKCDSDRYGMGERTRHLILDTFLSFART